MGRGVSRAPAPASSRSGSSYYGDAGGIRRGGGNCEDCLDDLGEFCGCNMCDNCSTNGICSLKRICLGIIVLWLFILTIICIVLGSNIGKIVDYVSTLLLIFLSDSKYVDLN